MIKKIKTVLIGFGAVAAGVSEDKKMAKYYSYQSHADVLKAHPCFEWNAVVDPNEDARKYAQNVWGVPVVVESVDKLPHPAEYDVAVIATRANIRKEIVEQLPAVKAILVEKPIANSHREAVDFTEVCKKKNIKILVNLFRRADKTNHFLKNQYIPKNIGNIQAGTIIYGNGILNNGIHMINLLRMLCGKIMSVRALSESKTLDEPKLKDDCNIAAALTLVNGAVITMQPINFKHYRDVILDLWGEKGRLEIYQESLYIRYSPIKEHRAVEGYNEISIDQAVNVPNECGNAYYEMYNNLLDIVKNNTTPVCTALDAIEDHRIIENILLSAKKQGDEIRLEDAA